MNSHATAATMPAVFISHDSPMVAIQRGPYQDALAKFGREVRPRAIVAISAHWDGGGVGLAQCLGGLRRFRAREHFHAELRY